MDVSLARKRSILNDAAGEKSPIHQSTLREPWHRLRGGTGNNYTSYSRHHRDMCHLLSGVMP